MTEFAVAMGILLGTILIGIPISYSMGITGLVYILIILWSFPTGFMKA